MKRKSKEYYYSLGGVALLIGIIMIVETLTDIMKKAPNGVLPGGSPVGFVWGISVIAGIVCIVSGAVYIYKGKKKSNKK
jgi:hypothetical protein